MAQGPSACPGQPQLGSGPGSEKATVTAHEGLLDLTFVLSSDMSPGRVGFILQQMAQNPDFPQEAGGMPAEPHIIAHPRGGGARHAALKSQSRRWGFLLGH